MKGLGQDTGSRDRAVASFERGSRLGRTGGPDEEKVNG